METIIFVTIFCLIVCLIIFLLIYVISGKRKKAFRLYQDAAMHESKGNYTEAIKLFEDYLRENGDEAGDALSIEQRIKTLRALTIVIVPA